MANLTDVSALHYVTNIRVSPGDVAGVRLNLGTDQWELFQLSRMGVEAFPYGYRVPADR